MEVRTACSIRKSLLADYAAIRVFRSSSTKLAFSKTFAYDISETYTVPGHILVFCLCVRDHVRDREQMV